MGDAGGRWLGKKTIPRWGCSHSEKRTLRFRDVARVINLSLLRGTREQRPPSKGIRIISRYISRHVSPSRLNLDETNCFFCLTGSFIRGYLTIVARVLRYKESLEEIRPRN